MTDNETLKVISDEFFNSCRSRVILFTKNKGEEPTRQEISDIVDKRYLALADDYALEGVEIPEHVLKNTKTRLSAMGAIIPKGSGAFSVTGKRVKRWLNNEERDWPLWDSYKTYLSSRAISDDVLIKTERSIDNVIDLLGDPNLPGLRKGLVMGNVQSGKTMHFIGLLNKAIDAGYHTIIVLGGHLNELRTQTQIRIEEGLCRNSNELQLDSVSAFDSTPLIAGSRPLSWTTIEQDLNSLGANIHRNSDLEKHPVVLTIKKNVSILKSVIKLLQTKKGLDKPMLLIDDEADYASINTKHAKAEYASTNEQIRNLLSLFEKRAYVAYTATPFANVFIPFLNTTSGNKDDDLFPSDFMLKMPIPSNYVGQDFYFPSSETSEVDSPVININHISETEGWLPLKHKKDHMIDGLDWQLIEAIDLFLIVIAIRYLRGATNDHNTMMVNVSRFNDIQQKVAFEISDYLATLVNSLRHFGNLYRDGIKSSSKKIQSLEELFNKEYKDVEVSFEDVLSVLIKQSHRVEVELVNGMKKRAALSRGSLDYGSRAESGYWVIAVGGLKLSRGLTLENLSITYFLRNALAYDTLTQMCRWFGYRPGYKDLCRLYLTTDSEDHYISITRAIEDLYEQLRTMSILDATPRELGLRIEKSDPVLLVTAKNKLGEGKEIDYNISMSANFFGAYRPYRDITINKQNLGRLQDFMDDLRKSGIVEREAINSNESRIFEDVPYHLVISYLTKIKLSPNKIKIQNLINILRKLETKEAQTPRVMIFSRNKLDGSNLRKFLNSDQIEMIAPITIGDSISINPIVKTMSVRNDYLYVRNTKVSDPDDLRHSFTKEEEEYASSMLDSVVAKPINAHFRELIKKPVLVIHLVYPLEKNGEIGNLPLQDVPATLFEFHMPSVKNLSSSSPNIITEDDLEERGRYIENEIFRGATIEDATDEEEFFDE
jgi:hypothetical protein